MISEPIPEKGDDCSYCRSSSKTRCIAIATAVEILVVFYAPWFVEINLLIVTCVAHYVNLSRCGHWKKLLTFLEDSVQSLKDEDDIV